MNKKGDHTVESFSYSSENDHIDSPVKSAHSLKTVQSPLYFISIDRSMLKMYLNDDELRYKVTFCTKESYNRNYLDNMIEYIVPFSSKLEIKTLPFNSDNLRVLLSDDQPDFFNFKLNEDSMKKGKYKNNNFYVLKHKEFLFNLNSDQTLLKVLMFHSFIVLESEVENFEKCKKSLFNIIFLKRTKRLEVIDSLESAQNTLRSKITSLSENYIINNVREEIKVTLANLDSLEKSGDSSEQDKIVDFHSNQLDLIEIDRFFQIFDFSATLFILMSILAEKNIFFISHLQSKISSAISLFTYMIKPYLWTFPIIYSVPKLLLDLIESPIPLIAGIMLDYMKIKTILETFKNHKNSIYVFLDHGYIRTDKRKIEDIKVPSFGSLIDSIYTFYNTFYPKTAHNKFNPKLIKIRKYGSIFVKGSKTAIDSFESKVMTKTKQEHQIIENNHLDVISVIHSFTLIIKKILQSINMREGRLEKIDRDFMEEFKKTHIIKNLNET